MEMFEILEDKKVYMDLLLLADEQESMIDRYLESGRMYILKDPDVRGVCVVTEEGDGILEVKNLAIDVRYQRRGYGKYMLDFIAKKYGATHRIVQVGTGDSPLTIPFYEKCGFVRSHVVKNFFTENYDHSIFEAGMQLVDMVYLRKIILPCESSLKGIK